MTVPQLWARLFPGDYAWWVKLYIGGTAGLWALSVVT